jgi:hypothetical protein
MSLVMPPPRIAGFRLGVYIFKDAEVVDFAAFYRSDFELATEAARLGA